MFQLSGLSMSAPSPPVTFEPPQGHSGHTPTGPVLQMTPNQGWIMRNLLNGVSVTV